MTVAATIGLAGAIVQAGGRQEIGKSPGREREAYGERQESIAE